MKIDRFSRKFLIRIALTLSILFFVSCKHSTPTIQHIPVKPLPMIQIEKKPLETNLNWKRIIGKYQKMDGTKFEVFLIREENQKLFLYYKDKDYELAQINFKEYRFQADSPFKADSISFVIDKKGNVPLCMVKDILYEQIYYDLYEFDFTNFLTPSNKISKDNPSLILVKDIDPTLQVNFRFAPKQPAFLEKNTALALRRANQLCNKYDLSIVLYDAYRPIVFESLLQSYYPKSLWKDSKTEFSTGTSLSIALFDIKSAQIVDMGSSYLESSERSSLSYIGGTSLQRFYRLFLQTVMKEAGFSGTDLNWWYFTYKGVN